MSAPQFETCLDLMHSKLRDIPNICCCYFRKFFIISVLIVPSFITHALLDTQNVSKYFRFCLPIRFHHLTSLGLIGKMWIEEQEFSEEVFDIQNSGNQSEVVTLEETSEQESPFNYAARSQDHEQLMMNFTPSSNEHTPNESASFNSNEFDQLDSIVLAAVTDNQSNQKCPPTSEQGDSEEPRYFGLSYTPKHSVEI